jgi:hypothetical protein
MTDKIEAAQVKRERKNARRARDATRTVLGMFASNEVLEGRLLSIPLMGDELAQP